MRAFPIASPSAIEVLRTSSMSTYENRRIATGVLLFGSMPRPCHTPPADTQACVVAIRIYFLTSIRSFHRLCDGLRTLALVDQNGLLAELIDVHDWAEPYRDMPLAVPPSAQYADHCRATLCGGHICLILSPNGEIKIYSDGVPVFRFIDGKWRLVDARHRYDVWKKTIGNAALAERLFTVALNLTESRRGALFVVLDDRESANKLVSQPDLLDHLNHDDLMDGITSKDQLRITCCATRAFSTCLLLCSKTLPASMAQSCCAQMRTCSPSVRSCTITPPKKRSIALLKAAAPPPLLRHHTLAPCSRSAKTA